jgi:hypothetical protein
MHSLTSALDGGEWSTSRLSRFTPREGVPGAHWIRIVLRSSLFSFLIQKMPPFEFNCLDWNINLVCFVDYLETGRHYPFLIHLPSPVRWHGDK